MELNDLEVTTPPRDAASVILLRRSSSGGLQVLMLRRHDNSDVLGGAYVFPGGKVDPNDATAKLPQEREMTDRLGEPGLSALDAAALYQAAARETLEEAAVELALDQLFPWSRWITPRRPSMMSKRFDTRFFIAVLPGGQAVRHDDHETVETLWIEPRAALERYWEHRMRLAPPQIMSLAHLARFGTPSLAIEEACSRRPGLIEPESFTVEGGRVLVYPGDTRHSILERALPGPTRLYWRNDRFEPEQGFDGFFEAEPAPQVTTPGRADRP